MIRAVGTSADNAACESFHSSLKRETLQGARDYGDASTCRRTFFAWLARYNTRLRHSANVHLSPNEYERKQTGRLRLITGLARPEARQSLVRLAELEQGGQCAGRRARADDRGRGHRGDARARPSAASGVGCLGAGLRRCATSGRKPSPPWLGTSSGPSRSWRG
ncbi:integrase core domain-containing protein [Streptomyces sp. NPDC001276]|uniref:integrase core domain-containing protein n=1 Tax=Streptomyces sp. NPDC001276 TaxID=3364555 RepID=UPI0036AB3617